ncbi:MAG: pyruvate, water dikinase regulatory protein [Peptostreptococcales bacterium]|jgi:regulator of PEP synthase PpsR (kinase-PPPase family)
MYKIYVISDSIGETAEQVVKAAISQFGDCEYEIKRYSYISSPEEIIDIISEASAQNGMIAFTIVIPELKKVLLESVANKDIHVIDIMSSITNEFSNFFNQEPINKPGLIRKLDAKYFKRVEAVEFAVKYDDGKNVRGIKEADVVIVGVSRTSKTPLCMFLAHKNIKAANIPLVPEVDVPKELFEIDNKKIIGLVTDPVKLNEIRQERLKALGLSNDANYASMDRILLELDYAEKIMKKLGCPVIDVSTKAVEETANIIFKKMNLK